jgi:hypothetical protein
VAALVGLDLDRELVPSSMQLGTTATVEHTDRGAVRFA